MPRRINRKYTDERGIPGAISNNETVVRALIKPSKKVPSELYQPLTWERGTEMTKHHRFTLETNIKVYSNHMRH
ncbi:hypothetical protein N9H37_02135 [Congregibacter sp.]|nr:hypothetical protein [Congregibacter sp.]MDA8962132.1 hypothetical protein [Congregibacter sp.]